MAQLNNNKINTTKKSLPVYLQKLKQKLATSQATQEKYVLELKNINKIYENGFQAIFKTNIKLKKGDFLSLLGPSGCGKSTTLRVIAGLEKANQGEIYINNVNVTHSESSSRNLTMVFQNYALFPHLSVKKNIAFGLNANKNKSGDNIEIFQKINFKKNQIAEINWKIKNVRFLHLNKYSLNKLQQKRKIAFNKLQNFTENNKAKQIRKYNKLFAKVTFLDETIEYKKENITFFEKLRPELEKLIQKKIQHQKEIKELKQQIKKLSNNEKNRLINEKVELAAKTLGLDFYLNRKPSQLSGGQRQRVALGRSIVNNPILFLMDEPLSNLDAQLRSTMRQEIRKLHEKINSGTIYVTHDQVEAMTMSDKLAVMEDGFILQIGTPKDVYKNPSCLFVASFVGTPAMNFVEGVYKNQQFISKKGLVIDIPIDKTPHLKESQKITLGIRPSDFSTEEFVYDTYKTKIKVKIVSKELLGNEIQYKGKTVVNNEEFTFITSSYNDFKISDKVEIFIISSRIHLFDTESTIALTSKFNYETIEAIENWLNSSSKIKIRRLILEETKKVKEKKSFIKNVIIKTIDKFKNNKG
ncbi:ATP-binding cassette domain-containing protein [Mesomycoplasma neurolyticum]|uniref:ABC-type maltose/maltodextrin transporter ATP-binding protein MalK n=1 Tax=Mesomycoplasma neurolyticum TaxID=2120 RepID=A0A449A5P7_9BACT|nr:ABC transporter ATP-binding protein [Mesomycoplasma neurolyticum]VEU59581.1 ABC-type maltose/maltodextrin transporter ATP-binding protein MalK [Mesomycoplasma neurolyticum]